MTKPQITQAVQTDKLRVQDDTYYKVTITVYYKYPNTTEFHPHHVKYVENQTDKIIKAIGGSRHIPDDRVHRLYKGDSR